MKTLDYLPNTDIYLYQDTEMFRINSDTRYLGEFLCVRKDDVVLDIGTNNGALLLYANKSGCKKLIGVDVNEKAIELCKENMIYNKVNNYELHSCRVQDLVIDKVDVIVCNPPYFKNSNLNKNELVKNARHDECLKIEELASSCNRLLKDNGKVFIVYKSSEIMGLLTSFDNEGFGVNKLKFIFDENKDVSNCFLIELVKGQKHNVKVVKPVVIRH